MTAKQKILETGKDQVAAIQDAITKGMEVSERDGVIHITCPRSALANVPGAPTEEVEKQVADWNLFVTAGLTNAVVDKAKEQFAGGDPKNHKGSITLHTGEKVVNVTPKASYQSFVDGKPVNVTGPRVTVSDVKPEQHGKELKHVRDEHNKALAAAIAGVGKK